MNGLDHSKPGPWYTIFRFNDGRVCKERALYTKGGDFAGIETRIFSKDGKLEALPDGRTSLADTKPA